MSGVCGVVGLGSEVQNDKLLVDLSAIRW